MYLELGVVLGGDSLLELELLERHLGVLFSRLHS